MPRGRALRRPPVPLFEPVEPRLLLAGDLAITEFMADNTRTLADHEGDYSDWVEIYNKGTAAADLSGLHLTDTASNLTKWEFPAGVGLGAGAYLVVFASGKNRTLAWTDGGGMHAEYHTNFKLAAGGDYLALIDRDGQTQDVSVTLEARPEPLAPAIPLLPELEGIPADELLGHVQGGQFNFTDEQGNPLTVTIDVGTVASVDTGVKTLTLTLNAGGSKTYTVEDEDLGAKLSDLNEGDRVAVMRVGDDVRAVVRGVGPLLPGLGRGHGFGCGRGHMGRFGEWQDGYGGPMMPQEAPEEAPAPGTGL